ncbi:hypothetical protein LJC64_04725 [Ruminococcaceae bacterium OttesenSCG-928-A11]|nr:hypothetical protein [Ruminococcaceae bacterium OttesenSCG-928-A11]
MKRVNIIKGCGLLISAMAVVVLPFLPVAAEDEATPATWIQISPVSERINLGCEQEHDGKFKVSNIGSEAFDFEVYANSYGVSDMSYDPIFDKETTYTQLSGWISFGQKTYDALAPGESVEVPYHISVPANCPGGGQYAVLFAQTIPKGEITGGMGLQTVSRVGELIFANMGGETQKTGEFISFEQNWWTDGKITSTTVIKNTGNVDFAVNQTFTVKNLFGKEMYTSTPNKSVLPETSREMVQTWEETPMIGLFNVTNQTSFIGQTPVNETKLVLVAPLWFIIAFSTVFCLILILIVVIIVTAVRNRKNKKLTK